MANDIKGTMEYRPIECYQNETLKGPNPHDPKKVDVFALGVVLLAMTILDEVFYKENDGTGKLRVLDCPLL
jgi:hypothetical protein